MKTISQLFLTIFLLTSFSNIALAQSLEKNMKAIGKNFKSVSKQVDQSSKNADTILKVDAIISSAEKAKLQTPELIEDLAQEKQAQSLTQYQNSMQKLIDKANELKKALASNDNILAKNLTDEMKKIRKEGHKEFKKDDD